MTDSQSPTPLPDAQRDPPASRPPAPPIAPDGPPPGSPPPALPPRRPEPRRDAGWVAGLFLVGLGALLLVGREVPDAGRYVVLVVGLGLLVLFAANREYGVLVPGCIVTGVGLGIVLASEYTGEVGGALFMLSLGGGFLAIWVIGGLFRLSEHHGWPLVPGLILGSIGAATAAGERGRPAADAIATGWPLVLVLIGLWLVGQALLARRT